MSEVNPVLGYADSYRLMMRMADAEGRPRTVEMFSVITDLERNIAPIFTAVQSELSALREELARKREALTDAECELEAAEQRNAAMANLLRRSVADRDQPYKQWWNERAELLLACTQPSESGASE